MIKHHFKTQNLHLSRVGESLIARETCYLTLETTIIYQNLNFERTIVLITTVKSKFKIIKKIITRGVMGDSNKNY